ncbi:TonB-dependent receptor domain-containing protein [Peristeroidobacter agariperforans]|uniref:TonB-dependent receptor domain-containing protein n=1 Tax=Peristeroidobacter agariperforans TaxID=268404 RepID=UPI00101C2A17|nr:TonB-dependent receptor [Peristeroidobacter agariperforans]
MSSRAAVRGWLFLSLLMPLADAGAQATANAVAVAEDAFGSTEGDESVGIYDQTSVRGFSLEAAGNYRINGRYFVKNGGVSSFFLEKTIVRIGYNALFLDHPGPSGVVDYKLRDPRRDEPSLVTLGVDSYEQPFTELHFKYRNPADTLSMSLGASRRFRWADEQGGEGNDWLVAGTMRATLSSTARVQLFGGEYRYRRHGRFRVSLAPEAEALPAEIERGRYLGQSWATETGAKRIVGALADLDLEDDWTLRAIAVFSQEAPDRRFTQLFSNVTADGLAQSSVIISPEQRSRTYSAEAQLGKTFRTGPLAHSVAADARFRDSDSRFGGERAVTIGEIRLAQSMPDVAAPNRQARAAALRDTIDQQGLGLSYQVALPGRFRASSGVLYSDYAKRFTNDAGIVNANESAPWLYNLGAVVTVRDAIELYGSYTRGLEEAGIAPSTAANANAVLEATIAAQKELGLRYSTEGATLIVAGFDTRKPQVGIDAVTGSFDFLGEVTHRGIETSLSGALMPKLSAILGAVYTEAEVRGPDVDARFIGRRAPGVPDWRAVAAVNYQLSPRISLDVGIEHLGERVARSRLTAATGSQLMLSPSTVVDIGARFGAEIAGQPVVMRAQVLNVFDTFAWKPAPGETLDYVPQRSLRVLLTMPF